MTRPKYYPPADHAVQWFSGRFPGARMTSNVGLWHTTETSTWPGYSGGAVAPNLTAKPNHAKKRLDWRQHFGVDESARALQNRAGGVETNTLNVLQIELVGTCDPATSAKWGRAGIRHVFWPEPPAWALRDLAEFVAWCQQKLDIPIASPGLAWRPYPSSYGLGASQRMSGAKWRSFYGWCGHQHAPENDHGDPGAFPIDDLLARARAIVDPPKPQPAPAPEPAPVPDLVTEILDGSDEHMAALQVYSVPGDGRDYVLYPDGGRHIPNKVIREKLVDEGRITQAAKPITEAERKQIMGEH